jgi:hypothetical protein
MNPLLERCLIFFQMRIERIEAQDLNPANTAKKPTKDPEYAPSCPTRDEDTRLDQV